MKYKFVIPAILGVLIMISGLFLHEENEITPKKRKYQFICRRCNTVIYMDTPLTEEEAIFCPNPTCGIIDSGDLKAVYAPNQDDLTKADALQGAGFLMALSGGICCIYGLVGQIHSGFRKDTSDSET